MANYFSCCLPVLNRSTKELQLSFCCIFVYIYLYFARVHVNLKP